MQRIFQVQPEQVQIVKTSIYNTFGSTLLGIYLHGSAVSGRLMPQSDLDILAVISRPMTDAQREKLLTDLLRISSCHPSIPGGSRCVEVMVFLQANLFEDSFLVQAEFVYGEWLRENFETGKLTSPVRDPENTLILAQTRQQAITLFGESPLVLLPEISRDSIHQAISNALPTLFEALQKDTRNVLLTLARMWYTARIGDFVTKDAAASWAIPQMSNQDADILDYARLAYLGEIDDEWEDKWNNTKHLAKHMRERIFEFL